MPPLNEPQAAAERKHRLHRFGEAVKEQAGDSVTVRQAEDVPFERMQKARQTTEEKRAEKEDLKSALAGSDKSAVVGRWAHPADMSLSSGATSHHLVRNGRNHPLHGSIPSLWHLSPAAAI